METNEQAQAWQQAIRVRTRWQMVKDWAQLTPIQFAEAFARAAQSDSAVMSKLQVRKAGAVSSLLQCSYPSWNTSAQHPVPAQFQGCSGTGHWVKLLFPLRESNCELNNPRKKKQGKENLALKELECFLRTLRNPHWRLCPQHKSGLKSLLLLRNLSIWLLHKKSFFHYIFQCDL